jgi:hypothetical protein
MTACRTTVAAIVLALCYTPTVAQVLDPEKPAGEAAPAGWTFSIRFPVAFREVDFGVDGRDLRARCAAGASVD